MNVSLTPQLEQYIAKKVEEGNYQTNSEVVREALRLMIDREQREVLRLSEIERLRAEIAKGMKSVEEGRTMPFDPKQIKAEGRRRLAERRKKVG